MEVYRDEKEIFFGKVMASDKYKSISNRLDLYERVKLVKGKDFITIEDTDELKRKK